MMRYRTLGALLAVIVLATVSSTALAQAERGAGQRRQRENRVSVAQIPVAFLKSLCDLTPEQEAKIKDIQTKLESQLRELRPARGQEQDPQAAQKRQDLIRQATTEINNILTPEQREALRKAAPEVAMLRSMEIPLQLVAELKLTDEQKQKLMAIAREMREKVAGLSPEERRSKMRELTAEARTKAQEVLTDEQKAKIQKFREENRRTQRRNRNQPPL